MWFRIHWNRLMGENWKNLEKWAIGILEYCKGRLMGDSAGGSEDQNLDRI
jgi:hypothetical protein